MSDDIQKSVIVNDSSKEFINDSKSDNVMVSIDRNDDDDDLKVATSANHNKPQLEKKASTKSSFKVESSDFYFDWKIGRYLGNVHNKIPIHVAYILQMIISITIHVLVTIFCLTGVIPHSPSDYAKEIVETCSDGKNMEWNFLSEFARWSISLTAAHLSYCLTILFILAISPFIYNVFLKFKKGKDVSRNIRRPLDRIFTLRKFISWLVGALIFFICTRFYFPVTEEDNLIRGINKSKKNEQKAPEKNGPGAGDKDSDDSSSTKQSYRSRFYDPYAVNFYANSISIWLLVVSGILLLEKITIDSIEASFHKRSFGKRIEDTRMVRKIGRNLREQIIKTYDVNVTQATGSIIAQGCLLAKEADQTERKTGESVDFFGENEIKTFVDPQSASTFCELTDLKSTGKWDESSMLEALEYWDNEEEVLRLGVHGHAEIISKLDYVIMTLVCVPIFLFLGIFLLRVNISVIVTAIGGFSAIMIAMTSKIIVSFIESIIFVIVSHPFDVGDKVILGGSETCRVVELGLWTCTFFSFSNGSIVYYRNIELNKMQIVNIRRSPPQSEEIKIEFDSRTSKECLDVIESRMNEFVLKNPQEYISPTRIVRVTLINKESIQVIFDVKHRLNFQNGDAKTRRTTNFLLELRRVIADEKVLLRRPSRESM